MSEQASMLFILCAFRLYSVSPSRQNSEYSSVVLGWNSPKHLTASSNADFFMRSASNTVLYSRQNDTKRGWVSGRAKLRIFKPQVKLQVDLLVMQQGMSIGCSLFFKEGFQRYYSKLLSLARVALNYQFVPMVLPKSNSILSSFGLTCLKRSSLTLASVEGALRKSFWISKEGKSKVFKCISNSILSPSLNGFADLNRGTVSSKLIERPQCHRTALSKQPAFTGGGYTVEILKYLVHFIRTIFQNYWVYTPSPKTRLRQSRAKELQLLIPSVFFQFRSFSDSLLFEACPPLEDDALSLERSDRACRNSFLIVRAKASIRTSSRTQGRAIFSQIRQRYRTLIPISCIVHLIEQLSTSKRSRSLSLSMSTGSQQASISLLASMALRSSSFLASSAMVEYMKA